MAIKYGSTTLSKVVYNGSTIYSINYNGTKYCVSCSYSTSSCGPCSSAVSSLCNSICTSQTKITKKCGSGCSMKIGSVFCNSACTASVGLNSINPPIQTMSLMNSRTSIATYKLEPKRAEWLRDIYEEVNNWQETYETYYENPDIPEETQEEIKRVYNELKQSFEEDLFVLGEELKELFPNMSDYQINYGVGIVDVF